MATNEAVRWFMMIGFLVVSISQSCAYGKPEVPCFFIFGDSLLDNGNNNFLPTLRVNYLPYGIDYPTGPTGRFCNGRTPVDVLGLASLSLSLIFLCYIVNIIILLYKLKAIEIIEKYNL